MRSNGNFSDASLERLRLVSTNRVMSPIDAAADLESLLIAMLSIICFAHYTFCSVVNGADVENKR